MIETMDCAEARLSLGVYVLGAIDPAERALVDAHLATCRDCRDELAGLAGLPALLARVSKEEAIALADDSDGDAEADAESASVANASVASAETPDEGHADAPAMPESARADAGADITAATTDKATDGQAGAQDAQEPPSELLGAVLDLTAARRRRRNWRNTGLSAAAAVIIAAAAFGGARLAASPGTSPAASAQAAQNFNYGSPVSGWATTHGETAGMYAAVTYRGMSWGTQLAAKVVGVPVGTLCQLIIVGPGGTKTVAGAWTTDTAEGTVYYPGSAGVSPQKIQEFQITVAGRPTIVVPS
jgi:hypothetical protein